MRSSSSVSQKSHTIYLLPILTTLVIENGLGLQAENLEPSNFEMIGKALYAAMIAYWCVGQPHLRPERLTRISFGIGFVKLSILIMYYRIFDTRRVRMSVKIVGVANLLWVLLFIALAVFQCTPVPRAWNPTIPGKCIDAKALFIANAVPNIVIDLFMVAIPIYPVSKLRLPVSQRIALIGLFMLGGIVCVVSIYRVTTISTLSAANLAFTIRGAAVLGNIEVATAIVSASLPTLRPLFSTCMRAVGLSSGSFADQSIAKAPRSRSSTLLSDRSGKSKGEGFSIIVEDNSQRLALKPLPKLPAAAMNPKDKVGMAPLHEMQMRRDEDLEIARLGSGRPYPG